MYRFRYLAIGHSYLKHGPFEGWQSEGFWGMAASAPEHDYFHTFQRHLMDTWDCRVEAVATNVAAYERLCTEEATEHTYRTSEEYRAMQKLLAEFKPNIISVFVGGGNTPAKDERSLTRFFEVLYRLIDETRLPGAAVLCISKQPTVHRISKAIADRYGFVSVDVSFLHEVSGRDNPYYAFRDYPAYDEYVARGAVEFRTHPNDAGHAAIAAAMLDAARDAIDALPEGDGPQADVCTAAREEESPPRLRLAAASVRLSFFGFNVRQQGDDVVFGSAPGTGASLLAEGLFGLPGEHTFYAELCVDGAAEGDELTVRFLGTAGECELAWPIVSSMHRYEVAVSQNVGVITAVRLAPTPLDCVVRVRTLGLAP